MKYEVRFCATFARVEIMYPEWMEGYYSPFHGLLHLWLWFEIHRNEFYLMASCICIFGTVYYDEFYIHWFCTNN
jgi:hypothetical protein